MKNYFFTCQYALLPGLRSSVAFTNKVSPFCRSPKTSCPMSLLIPCRTLTHSALPSFTLITNFRSCVVAMAEAGSINDGVVRSIPIFT